MQYRYKVANSYEARKSSNNTPSQTHKNDALTYINLLDKCTQILREDRIWIRNQLKSNDQEVFKIFKQAKRPINLQHLQIRLRKYVAGVKSKAKMEQLIKFKENMHLGDWMHPREDNKQKQKSVEPQHKRQNKYQIPSNTNTAQDTRGLKTRLNNSVERQAPKSAIYPYRNTSANSKQRATEHYPAPMEQITERQSENMTSARHKGFNQDYNYNYSQNYSNSNSNGQTNAFSHSYTQWKRPQDNLSSGLSSGTSSFLADPFKPKMQTSYFNNFMADKGQPLPKPPIAFPSKPNNQKIASKNQNPQVKPTAEMQVDKSYKNGRNSSSNSDNDGYEQQGSIQIKQSRQQANLKLHNGSNYNYNYNYNQSYNYNQHSNSNNSLQHAYESEERASSYFNNYSPNGPITEVQKQQKQGLRMDKIVDPIGNANSSNSINSINSINNISSTKMESSSVEGFSYNIKTVNDMHRHSIQETNLLNSKCANTLGFSSATANQSLFTSPELLAECRNFLKLKSSAKPSTQKQYNNRFALDFESKVQPLKFDSIEPSKPLTFKQEAQSNSYSESSLMSIFANVQCGTIQKLGEVQQNNKYENYTKSNQQITKDRTIEKNKQQANSASNLNQNTFVGYANLKQSTKIQQSISQPSINVDHGHSGAYEYFHTFSGLSSQKKQLTSQLSNAQQFVDSVMAEAYDMPQGFVSWDVLQQLMRQKCPQFIDSFKQYLYPTDDERMVLVSNVGRLLEDLLSQVQTQETDNEVRSMYKLLDIEQKGYITENDIEDFIRQLQDSQAEDIQTISQQLWKLFENVDRDTEEGESKKVDYWGLYARKNQPDFQELNEILKQFQFQIE